MSMLSGSPALRPKRPNGSGFAPGRLAGLERAVSRSPVRRALGALVLLAGLVLSFPAAAQVGFGTATIDDQTYIDGVTITDLTLPAATGGAAPLTYTLTPALPAGLNANLPSGTTDGLVSGTPSATTAETTYTLTATDANNDTAELTFKIAVEADTSPTFGTASVDDRTFIDGVPITVPLALPAATGGNAPLSYTLTPALPAGLTFTSPSGTTDGSISGTPSATMTETEYTLTATDADNDAVPAPLTFKITVEADTSPTFGTASVDDRTFIDGVPITVPLALPAATGGNAPLSYTLTPALPAGLTFTSPSGTTDGSISGTPSATMTETEYTLTATDADNDAVPAPLTFKITVEADTSPTFGTASVDDRTFIDGVPITVPLALPAATGGNAPLSYTLTPALPAGLTFTPPSGTTDGSISGTPSATMTETEYTLTATDADNDAVPAPLTFKITVEADTSPTFGTASVDDRTFIDGVPITVPLALPAATGGNAPLSYTLTPTLPAGLTFTPPSGTTDGSISGTPSATMTETEYTLTATDADNDAVPAPLTFKITVEADTSPDFSTASVGDQTFIEGVTITDLVLPAATDGNAPLIYSLTPVLPAGLSFDANTRTISGEPSATMAETTYTLTATDADGDTGTLTFKITVEADTSPDFGTATIANQTYTNGVAIADLQLPAATGGNAPLTYTLTLPAGLTFDEDTRIVSGTPTETRVVATTYTLTATDANGDTATRTFSITVNSQRPAKPANVAVTGGTAQLTVSWDSSDASHPLCPVSRWQLDYKKSGSVWRGGWDVTPANPNNQDNGAFDVFLSLAGSGSPYSFLIGANTPSTSLPPGQIGVALDGGSYEVRLRAYSNSAGCTLAKGNNYYSDYTDSVSATVTAGPPTFGGATIPAQYYSQNTAIPTLNLPRASGGTLTYSLTPPLPAGLTLNMNTRTVTGTPTETKAETEYIWAATDGSNTADVKFKITVSVDAMPSFGGAAVERQNWLRGTGVTLRLPAATNGDAPVTYSLAPALPAGMTFNAGTRIVSGTPSVTMADTTYTLTATDADGDTATLTFPAAVNFRPAAPTGLTATGGARRITMSWSWADDTGGVCPLTRFRVYYYRPGDDDPVPSLGTATPDRGAFEIGKNTTSITFGADDSLDKEIALGDGKFDVAVQAFSEACHASRSDNHASSLYTVASVTVALDPPAAPENLTATAGDKEVTLAWSDPNDGTITKYQVRWKASANLPFDDTNDSWDDVTGSSATTTGHTVTGLTNGTAYTFEVRAVNGDGGGAASSVAATPEVVPDAPTGLAATVGDKEVTLNWTLPTNVGAIGKMQVRYAAGTSVPSTTAWTDIPNSASTITHTVGNLTNGTEYTFEVRAVNSAGDGAAASVTATPDLVPDAPGNLQAAVGDKEVTLTWDLPTNVGAIGNIQVRYGAGASVPPTAVWTNVGASAITHKVTGLTNGTEYTFEVRAVNSAGNGTAASVTATPDVVPNAPTGLAATVGDKEVTLTWTLPTNAGAIGKMQVRYAAGTSVPSTTAWTDIPNSASAITHTVGNLTNGTEYTFEVRAVNSAGDGAAASVTATPDLVPDAPGNLQAAVGDKEVTLNWTLPTNVGAIGNIQVRYGAGASVPPTAVWTNVGASAITHKVTGLTNGTEYTFEVRAVNSAGNGTAASVTAIPDVVPNAPTGLAATVGDKEVTLNWTLPTNVGAIGKMQVRYAAGTSVPSTTAWTDIPNSASAITHTVGNLTNGTEYTFEVRAVNSAGNGTAASVTATPDLVPDAPGNLQAAVGDKEVTLTWALPTNVGAIGNIQVRYGAGASVPPTAVWTNVEASAITHKVTGLTNGTEYTFEVRAVNSAGNGTAASVTAIPDVVPNAPTGLAATVGDKEVTLNWTLPTNAGAIGNMQVRYAAGTSVPSTAVWTNVGASAITHKVTGLTNGTEYTFEVRAVNSAGDGAAASVTATPDAVPIAPGNLAAAVGDTEVTLTWDLPTNVGAIGNIQVRYGAGASVPPTAVWTNVGASAITHKVTGLTNGTEYAFEVRAVNSAGNGTAASVTAIPDVVPDAPTGLAATVGDKEVTLNWTLPTNVGAIRDVEVRWKKTTDQSFGSWAGLNDGTATTHTVGSLTNGDEYTFEVRAVNSAGDGAAASVTATPDAVPNAPTGLAATVGDKEVTLNWTLPTNASAIGKMQVRYGAGSSVPPTATWTDLGASAITHKVTGLTNGTEYTFEVRAVNGAGNGTAASVTAIPDVVPGAPTNLIAGVGNTVVRLTWTAPQGPQGRITGYEVRYGLGNSVPSTATWTAIANSASATEHTVTGLLNNRRYTFQIRAVNTAGEGAASAEVSTTTEQPRLTLWLDSDFRWEDDDDPITVTASTLNRRSNAETKITISVTPADDATLSTNAVLTIPAGQHTSTGTVTITIKDNDIDDPDQRKLIVSGAVTSGNWVQAPPDKEITIEDEDASPKVTLVLTPDEISENGGVSTVTATLDRASSVETTVTVEAAPVSPAVEGDFTLSTEKVLTIPARSTTSSTSTTVTITGVDNAIDAPDKTVTVSALTVTNSNGVTLPDSQPLKITDDDDVPVVPGNLTATAGDKEVDLSWSDPNDSTITKYQVRWKTTASLPFDDTTDSWSDVAGSGATTTTHKVTGLTNETGYTFQVRAVSPAGNGAAASATATPKLAIPAAPGNLAATAGDTEVTLTWTLPTNASVLDKVQVRYAPGTSVPSTTAWTDIPNSASAITHTVTGLTNSQQYAFQVRAVNGAGESAASNTATATPLLSVPDAPGNLAAAAGDTEVTLTWTLPTNASVLDKVQVRYAPGTSVPAATAWTDIPNSASATTHTVTGLTNSQQYAFQVRAVNGAGESAASNTATATPLLSAPDAPTGLAATAGDTEVTLTWTLPTNASVIDKVQVRYAPGTSVPAATAWTDIPNSASAITHTVTGLTNSQQYAFQVRAVNGAGESAASNTATATPVLSVPDAPGNLAATAGDTEVTLTWTLPTNASVLDKVQVRYAPGTSVPSATAWTDIPNSASAITHTVTGLTNSQQYAFQVRAVNGAGESAASNTATATPLLSVPDAPGNLAATAGDTEVTLTWDLPTNASVLDKVQVRYAPGTSVPAATAWTDIPNSASAITHTVTGLTNSQQYAFQVRAVNGAGESAASNTATATPLLSAPDAPTGLAATAGDTEVTLTWTLPTNASVLDKVQVRYAPGTSVPAATAWTDIPNSASATTHTVTGLTNSQQYAFQVRAVNGAGESAASNTATATPLLSAPDAPTGLAATAGDTEVTLTWTLPTNASVIDKVQVRYAPGTSVPAATAWTDIPNSASAITHTVTGLTNSQQYAFQVRAVNGAGESAASNTATATPLLSVPDAPGNLAAAAGDTEVTLTWTLPTNASVLDKVQVRYAPGTSVPSTTAWTDIPNSASAITHTVTGLTNSQQYAFQVRAVNGAGESAASNTATATPLLSVPDAPGNLAATAGDTEVTLTWTLPTNASVLDKVQVRYAPGTSVPSATAWTDIPNSASAITHTVTGLTNSQQYAFQVRAVNGAGESAASNTATATPVLSVPDAPGNLAAAAGDTEVTLTWDLPTNASVLDKVQVRYAPGTSVPSATAWTDIPNSASAITHTVTGLTNSQQYAFQVRAVNGAGESAASNTATATPLLSVPDAPGNLAATAGDTEVTLTWTLPTNASVLDKVQVRYAPGTSVPSTTAWTDIPNSASAITHTVTGLTNSQQYAFQVRAVNGAGESAASNTATATPLLSVPDAPGNLAAAAGDTEVTLTWTLPTNASVLDKVQVRYAPGTSVPAATAWTDIPNSASAITHTVTGLTNSQQYAFQVRAVNGAGESAASNTATATPLLSVPDAPGNLAATAGDTEVTLTWTLPTNASVLDKVQVRYAPGTSVPSATAWTDIPNSASAITHTVTGLTNSQQYAFQVRAVNGAGESAASNTATATPLLSVPDAPGNLAATAGDTEVTLTWDLPTNASVLDKVQVRYAPGTSVPAATAWTDIPNSASAITHTVTGLTNSQQYAFQVRAVNGAGESAASNTATATPLLSVPDAPGNLAATAGDTEVTLTWDLPTNASVLDKVQVRYAPGTSVPAATAWTDIPNSASATTHTVTGLTNSQQYAFQVRAVNGAGESAASNTATATPLLSAPDAPTGLAATAGDTEVTLTWTLPTNASVIDKVQVRYAPGTSVPAATAWTDIPNSASAITHTVTGLTNSQQYAFQVRAVNGAGESAASNTATATPVLSVPDAPGNLAATAGDTEVTLTWTLPTNASVLDKVQVRYAPGTSVPSATAWTDIPNSASAITHTVTGLTNSQQYAFQVRAVNGAGESAASNTATATPLLSVPDAPGNLAATAGDTEVTLTWTLPTNASVLDKVQVRYAPGTSVPSTTAWTDILNSASAITHTVTGLTNSQQYAFQVRAVNGAGESAASNTATATPVLSVPTFGTATIADQTYTEGVAITNLVLPAASGGNGTLTYTLDGTLPTGLSLDETTRTISGTPTALQTTAVTYTWTVADSDSNTGDSDKVSLTFTITVVPPVPGVPGNLTAAAGDKKVTLTWTAASGTVAGYEYRQKEGSGDYGSWTPIANSASLTSYTVGSLTNGTAYTFQVRAVNAGGESRASNAATATPDLVPDAPGNLQAAVGDKEVTLTWVLPTNVGAISNMQVRHAEGTSVPSTVGWTNLGASAITHTVTGLTNGTGYTFEVRATNSVGSGAAARVAATPDVVPVAPTSLAAAVGDREVTLTWGLPTNAGAIDDIEVRWKKTTDQSFGSWTDLDDGTATTHTVGSLINGDEYTFEVRAVNSAGNGAAASVTATPDVVPVAPGNLQAAVGDREVTLTWALPTNVGAIDDIEVRWKKTTDRSFGSWTGLDDGTATTHTVGSLTNGDEYTFEVRAVNSAGNGAAASVTATPDAVPVAPGNLQAAVGDKEVTLTWALPTNVGAIRDIEVRWKKTADRSFGSWTGLNDGTATTHTVGSLTNGDEYTFEVRAVNSAGNGVAASVTAIPDVVPNAPGNLQAAVGDKEVTLTWALPINAGAIRTVEVRWKKTADRSFGSWIGLNSGSATRHKVSGLENGDEYTFEVRAVNSAGNGTAASVTAIPDVVPVAPGNLAAAVGNEEVTLTWDLPTNVGAIRTVEVRWKATASLPFNASDTWTDLASATATTHKVGNLTNGTGYTFEVRAVNSAGNGAAASVAATPDVVPIAPGNLAAAVGNEEVTLTWDLPTNVGAIGNMQVRYAAGTSVPSTAVWTNLGAGAITHKVTGLTNGTEYTFEVRAVNSAGNGVAASVTAIPDVVPNAPTNLAAAVGNTEVTLTWGLPTNAGAIRTVEVRWKATASLPFNASDTWTDLTSATATTHKVGNLTNGTGYTFEVRAVNSAGNGTAARVAATPDVVPVAPGSLAAVVGNKEVTLTWTLPTNVGAIDDIEVRWKKTSELPFGASDTWTDLDDGTATTHTVTGLENGTGYTFEVRAVNSAGNGAAARVAATPDLVPDAPGNLQAAVGDRKVTLTWALPTNAGALNDIEVRWKKTADQSFGSWTGLRDGTATTYDVTGLENGTGYTFEVRAVNSAGNGAAARVAATPDVVPNAPTSLAAAVGDREVTLTWALPTNVGAIDDIEVRWKKTTDPSFGSWTDLDDGTATTHTVGSLINGDEYTFEVRAVNSAGNGAAASVTATPDAVPVAPGNLQAAVGDREVTLTWALPTNVGAIDDIEVRWKKTADRSFGSWTDLDDGTATTHTVGSLTNGDEYTFEVRAVNSAGNGAAASVTATPDAVPVAPGNLQAAVGDKEVTLTWALPTNVGAIRDIEVRWKKTTDQSFGSWTGLNDGTATTHTVGSLTNGTEYTFEVRAVNSAGNGVAASVTAIPDVVPNAPGNLQAAVGDKEVTLTWALPINAGAIRTVEVRWKKTADRSFGSWIGLNSGTATRHKVSGLENGDEYTFEVRAVNSAGNGTAASVTAIPDVVPVAPGNLAAAVGNEEVTLTWDLPTNVGAIRDIEVRWKKTTDQSFGSWTGLNDGTATTHTVGSLTNGDEYTFEVRAVNSAGNGAAASVAATPDVVPIAPGNLAAAVGNTEVTLTWDLPTNVGAIGNMQVRYAAGTSVPSTAIWTNLGAGAITHKVTGLTNGTEYTFEVRAVNSAGNGVAASVTAIPDVVPNAPTNLAAAVGNTEVTLTWGLPTNAGAIRTVEVRWKATASLPFNASDTWTDLTSATATTHKVGNLTNGTGYTFEVRAVNSAGNGTAARVAATPDVVPVAPGSLAAVVGNKEVTLTWTLPTNVGAIDDIEVRWKKTSELPFGASDTWTDLDDGTATTHKVTGLENGTGYTFEVRAVNSAGNGAAARVAATPDLVPDAPGNLQAAVGDRKVTLTWALPTNAGALNDIEVRWKKTADQSFGSWTGLRDGTATTYDVTGLENGTGYTFEVRAVNSAGNGAAARVAATPDVVPVAPGNLQAAVGDREVTLTWALPTNVGAIDDIEVRWKKTTDPSFGSWTDLDDGTATTHTVGSLTNGDEYTFEVRAVNSAGNGAAASVAATPDAVPVAPGNLQAAVGDREVTLTWALPTNVGAIDDIEVRWKKTTDRSFGSWTGLNDGTATTHTVGSLTNGDEYTFEGPCGEQRW